jgi:GT2 family glycosyltransferase
MYFEDSDLSLAVGELAGVLYVPSVRIKHYGGGAARKGIRHTTMFIRSAWTFFRTHGWKLV